ncbi:amino acid adenylation domain-containing protein [Pseudoalteromonas piscicida]|uniref:amino acid adenylation domain-containing protein n=1 Tax=Pseudoalteromonas piscicida TaxID=43662 RepID=UPI0030B6601B
MEPYSCIKEQEEQQVVFQRVESGFPVSPLQQVMLKQDLQSGQALIHKVIFRFEGDVESDELESTLLQLIADNEVLRTTIGQLEDGQYVQNIHSQFAVHLEQKEYPALQKWMEQSKVPIFDGQAHRCIFVQMDSVSYLAMAFQAALVDVTSLAIIQEQISAALQMSEPAASLEVMQYADVSEWMLQLCEVSAPEEALLFNQLYGDLSSLEGGYPLTCHGLWSLSQSEKNLRTSIKLDNRVVCEAATLAQQFGVEQEVVYLAAYLVVLKQLSQQSGVLIDYLVDGRKLAELHDCIGLFDMVMPMHFCDVSSSVSELLDMVANTAALMRAPEHPYYLYQQLDTIDLPSCHFGFQFFEDATKHQTQMEVLSHNKHMLDLCVTSNDDGVYLHWQLKGRWHQESSCLLINRYHLALSTLTAQGVDTSLQAVEAKPYLSEYEQQWLQQQGNVSCGVSHRPFFETFLNAATSNLDNVALQYHDDQYSYGQLCALVSALSEQLARCDVHEADTVMIATEDPVTQIVVILATQQLAATFVAADTSWPLARLEFVAENSNAKAVVCSDSIKVQLEPSVSAACIVFDVEKTTSDKSISSLVSPKWNEAAFKRSAAYIVYTSGSTGEPKGVMISQYNLSCYIDAFSSHFDFEQINSLAGLGTFAADLTYTTLFCALNHGKTLRLFDKQTLLDADLLCKELQRLPVDMLKTVPTYVKALLELDPSGSFLPRQYLICGGELFDAELQQQLLALSPVCDVFNHYGPCETTIGVTMKRVLITPFQSVENQAVGSAMGPEVGLWVLDEHLRQLPIGHTGELYISGGTVGLGYLSNDVLTAEKWLENPYSESGKQLIYRTGDRARWRADGTLDVLGRLDDQLKIRGFRVELAEIESCLMSHPEVIWACVNAESINGHYQLYAYIVSQASLTIKQIQDYCKASLPAYAVPSFFSFVKELPRLSSGKVDRKRLQLQWQQAQHDHDAHYTCEFVTKIAAIYKKLLCVSVVKEDDDFFALGGNSIQAIHATAQLYKAFHITITPGDIFEHSTVAKMAHFIQQQPTSSLEIELLPVSKSQLQPLSAAQYRLWLMGRLSSVESLHIPFIFEVDGDLDPEILSQALTCVVNRHDILRSRFVLEDGLPKVKISETDKVVVQQLTACSGNEKKSLIAKLVETPIDIEVEPGYRFGYLRCDRQADVLVIVFHHLVMDGWSLDVLVNEVFRFYQALESNSHFEAETLQVQYQDYSVWQQKVQQSAKYQDLLSESANRLQGADTHVTLPCEVAHQQLSAPYDAKRHVVTLDQNDTESLIKKGRKLGLTPYMSLLSVFALLLRRYSGQQEFIVGGISSDRGLPELENLVGVFFNLLPVRLEVDIELSLDDYLKCIKEQCNRSRRHQLVSFDDLVEKLNPDRSTGQPLFNTLFYVQDQLKQQWKETNAQWQLKAISSPARTVNYDLTLAIEINDGNYVATFEYPQQRFKDSTMQLFAQNFNQLLQSFAKAAQSEQTRYHSLAQLGWSNMAKAVANGPALQSPSLDLLTKIQEHVINDPNKVAIEHSTFTVTYQQLWDRAQAVAAQLQHLPQHSKIGVCCYRHQFLNADILGILLAGGVYVPIDATTPKQRVEQIVEDARLETVLVDDSASELFASYNMPLLNIDTLSNKVETPLLKSQRCEGDTCYILFTSGSSGRPKGVEISNASLDHFMAAMAQRLPITQDDKWLACTTVAFDISLLELFLPLYVGASVVIAPDNIFRTPDMINQLVNEGANILQATPSMWSLLCAEQSTPSLKLALSGGEALSPTIAQQLISNHQQVWNLYGPTEATIWATATKLEPEQLHNGVPISAPIADTRLYVVDEHKRLLGCDMVGELAISGKLVGKGYINREELTQRVFLRDTLLNDGSQPPVNMYLTGDRVRMDQHGSIQFLGRFGNMIKLNGYRIELGDIESIAQSHPAIQQAVVSVSELIYGNTALVLYVSFKGMGFTQSDDWEVQISSWLSTRLPAYMLPALILELADIPTNNSGKVDRKKLPKPSMLKESSECNVTLSELETQLWGIWSRYFPELPKVMTVNWFALGGSSISMVTMLGEVQKLCRVSVPVKDFYLAPTLQGLNDCVKALKPQKVLELVGQRETALDEGPVTAIQEGIFATQASGFVGGMYNMSVCLKLSGTVDEEMLKASYKRVVEVQSQLRTRYKHRAGELTQSVVADFPLDIEAKVVQLSLEEAEHLQRVSQLRELRDLVPSISKEVSHIVNTPLSLEKGGVSRVRLLQVSEELSILVVVVHHIAMDEWSWRPLLEQWFAAYRGEVVSEPEVSFIEYATEQSAHYAEQDSLDYWRNLMAQAPELLEMSFAKRRPAKRSFVGNMVPVKLGADSVKMLDSMAKSHNTSFYTVLSSIYALTLHNFSHINDIVWGTALANRLDPKLFDVVGCFTNIVPSRISINQNESYTNYLLRIKEMVEAGLSYQGVPYPTLVKHCQTQVSPSYSPLVQNFLVYHNTPKAEVIDTSLEVTTLAPEYVYSEYDLDLGLTRNNDVLQGYFRFNTSLYNREQVEQMWEFFIFVCDALREHSGTGSVGELLTVLDVVDETEISIF